MALDDVDVLLVEVLDDSEVVDPAPFELDPLAVPLELEVLADFASERLSVR